MIELDDTVVACRLPTRSVLHDEKFSFRMFRILEQFKCSARLSELEEHGAVLLDLLDQGCAFRFDPIVVPLIEGKPGTKRQCAGDEKRAQGIGPEVNTAGKGGVFAQSGCSFIVRRDGILECAVRSSKLSQTASLAAEAVIAPGWRSATPPCGRPGPRPSRV